MSYRNSGGLPRLAQSSHHNWLHANNPKPVREPNRNGRVKTIKPRKPRRKKNTTMVNMENILSQLNGAATEPGENEPEAEPEVVEVVEEPTKTETVKIASGSISIAKKRRGNKVIPVLQIELDKDMLRKLGITI